MDEFKGPIKRNELYIASKRSLSSISLIWRAREIVDSGREALEDNASLCARNSFVRSALDKQVDSLEAIRYGATVVDAEGHDEFQVRILISYNCVHFNDDSDLTPMTTGHSSISRRRFCSPPEDTRLATQHTGRASFSPS